MTSGPAHTRGRPQRSSRSITAEHTGELYRCAQASRYLKTEPLNLS